MKPYWPAAVTLRGLVPVAVLCVYSATGLADNPSDKATLIAPARQQSLIRLVRNDCGSCHGLSLKGGLGTPLTPDAIADKPDVLLRETILRGRHGTAMPGWSDFITEAEAQWIVEHLKAGFPYAP